jgi:hypothetical protein
VAAGALLGKLPKPLALSAATLARIEQQLPITPSGPPAARFPLPATMLRWLGLGAALATATAVGAYLTWARPRLDPPAEPAGLPTAAVLPTAPLLDPATSATAPTLELGPRSAGVSPPVAAPPSRSSRPASRPRSTPPAPPPVLLAAAPPAPLPTPEPASESALLAESQLLGQALHQLHQLHDGQAALRSLQSYDSRFPAGHLREEALAARIDALVLLDRKDEALGLLDRSTFNRLARGGELRVLRAELRAQSGRCSSALSDFSWALSHQPTSGMAERALYGRAGCRLATHDLDGARADYSDYLQRFPTGRFAAAAQSALSR